jgi:hypothetical protein
MPDRFDPVRELAFQLRSRGWDSHPPDDPEAPFDFVASRGDQAHARFVKVGPLSAGEASALRRCARDAHAEAYRAVVRPGEAMVLLAVEGAR